MGYYLSKLLFGEKVSEEDKELRNESLEDKTMNSLKYSKMDSNVVKRRLSYEERISDRLSKVILQYLSLEDKLRLECVSQQFRRTLFEKHYFIDITRKMNKMSNESINKLLTKLHNLREISVIVYNQNPVFNEMVVKGLIKNCNNLTKIVINERYIELLNKEFIDKFGSTLVSLTLQKDYLIDQGLQTIPYLSQLSNIKELCVDTLPDLTDVHFTRLKRLGIHRLYMKDIIHFEVLIEDNRNTLKHLTIRGSKRIFDLNFWKNMFTLISKLENLVYLEIGDILSIDKQLDTNLTQIAVNCSQLKILYFHFQSFPELLSFINRLKALKRLDFSLNYLSIDSEKSLEINLSSLLKCKALQELTHLKIRYFLSYLSIDANNVFNDIEKNLPKLQSLIIDGIKFNCNENTAEILSRLSNLQTIRLMLAKDSPQHEIETQLKKKCKRITTIDFYEHF